MAAAPKSKVCTRCLKRKKLAQFGKNPRMKSGHKSYCKPCSADLQREWNAAQRTKVAQRKAPAKKKAAARKSPAKKKAAARKSPAKKKTTRKA